MNFFVNSAKIQAVRSLNGVPSYVKATDNDKIASRILNREGQFPPSLALAGPLLPVMGHRPANAQRPHGDFICRY